MKKLKEKSMFNKSVQCLEEGLKTVRKAICGKEVEKEISFRRESGNLNQKNPKAAKAFSVHIEYDQKGRAGSFDNSRKEKTEEEIRILHGKYLLQTTLKELYEKNIWTLYNKETSISPHIHLKSQ